MHPAYSVSPSSLFLCQYLFSYIPFSFDLLLTVVLLIMSIYISAIRVHTSKFITPCTLGHAIPRISEKAKKHHLRQIYFIYGKIVLFLFNQSRMGWRQINNSMLRLLCVAVVRLQHSSPSSCQQWLGKLKFCTNLITVFPSYLYLLLTFCNFDLCYIRPFNSSVPSRSTRCFIVSCMQLYITDLKILKHISFIVCANHVDHVRQRIF
jgi:hypothetical protein